jgi:hypothetical protein
MSLNPSVCFFTVCGGGEDYEFLLGQQWRFDREELDNWLKSASNKHSEGDQR